MYGFTDATTLDLALVSKLLEHRRNPVSVDRTQEKIVINGANVRQVLRGKAVRVVDSKPQKLELSYKENSFVRLRRIEGQVRGVQKMVEEDRTIPAIVEQIASIQEALRGLSRALMVVETQISASDAFRNGTPEELVASLTQSVELIYRHLR